MTYKVVQMCLRAIAFMLLIFALYFNTESEDITTCDYFVLSGVYGGYTVVTLGLLLEAGLHIDSDKLIECIFLVSAIFMNLLSAGLAFIQFYAGGKYRREALHKGLLSVIAGAMYLADIAVLFYT